MILCLLTMLSLVCKLLRSRNLYFNLRASDTSLASGIENGNGLDDDKTLISSQSNSIVQAFIFVLISSDDLGMIFHETWITDSFLSFVMISKSGNVSRENLI